MNNSESQLKVNCMRMSFTMDFFLQIAASRSEGNGFQEWINLRAAGLLKQFL